MLKNLMEIDEIVDAASVEHDSSTAGHIATAITLLQETEEILRSGEPSYWPMTAVYCAAETLARCQRTIAHIAWIADRLEDGSLDGAMAVEHLRGAIGDIDAELA